MKRSRITKLFTCVTLALALALACTGTAQAQDRRPQLSVEDTNKVWEIQVTIVGMELGLERESVGEKVLAAYLAARKSHQKARSELFAGGSGQRDFSAYGELNRKEREKLGAALKEILSEEQAAKVLTYLGTFSRTWDYMIHTVINFELEKEKREPVGKLMAAYIAGYAKAYGEGTGNRDWQAFREAMEKSKATLDAGLAEHLTEEELTQWKEATVSRRR